MESPSLSADSDPHRISEKAGFLSCEEKEREKKVLQRRAWGAVDMGILQEDAVVISPAGNGSDSTVVTVNCPDKTGLGCDLCRIILQFNLSICRGDLTTDGKWCYILFWLVGRPTTRWNLLKKRLLDACPSYFLTTEIEYYRPVIKQPRPPDVFLLKFWCSYDRKGLLHDVTEVLCELELTIKRVKVSTTPDGRVMDLFFVTDPRFVITSCSPFHLLS